MYHDGGNNNYVLIEMGDYFDTLLLPRLKKAAFSDDWKNGAPQSHDGISQVIKYHRLESYEDTLNNLEVERDKQRDEVLKNNDELRRDYMLHYMLETETKGSPSLLNIDEFADPTSYSLTVKQPGSDASTETNVDLLETFNYLIGLRVNRFAPPESFNAEFHRPEDPELPEDEHTRLEINGEMEPEQDGPWWFRRVTGWVPSDPMEPESSDWEQVLIIWRKLTGDLEKDNAMLDAYVSDVRSASDNFDYDLVYVNGSNNLAGIREEDESWDVHLLEKEFMDRMWDIEDV